MGCWFCVVAKNYLVAKLGLGNTILRSGNHGVSISCKEEDKIKIYKRDRIG